MNSPYRVHPALPSPASNTAPIKAAVLPGPGHAPPPPPQQPNKLLQLVKLEGELRKLPNWQATIFHALNEPQGILGHAQAYFFRANRRGKFNCAGASAVATIDTRAPIVQALNSVVNRLTDAAKTVEFDISQPLKSKDYAYPFGLWLPLLDQDKQVFGAFLFSREQAWTDDSKAIAERVAEAYGHALRVHQPPQLLRKLSLPKWALIGLPILLLGLFLIPVPLTTLAPFEIVPRDPSPVTAPLDGVIAEVVPEPNTPVQAGQVLFKLNTTELNSAVEVAAQRVSVAETKLATARNGAFSDMEMKRSITTLEQEADLARSEYDLANSRLSRAQIVADKDGLLTYTSRNDWLGKPVRVGEKVMEIADINNVSVRVDVGVHDAVALDTSQTMRLFFDADPLNPRRAEVYEKSYHAAERSSGQLSYTVRAAVTDDNSNVPRIGLRGTAQLIGDKVPLGFYLLRRPIAAVRQYLGL